MVKIWISEIEFNDGSKISFDKNDITVFVGPNNAGKSVTLKETARLLSSKSHNNKIVKSIAIAKEGSESELIDYLKSMGKTEYAGGGLLYRGYTFSIADKDAKRYWTNPEDGVNNLATLFGKSLTTEGRLTSVRPPKSIKLTGEAFTHPIHFLQRDDTLEIKFSNYFKQAFGTDLIVHRNAGEEVPLYVGDRPKMTSGEDRVSISYLKKIEALDLLHEQGDGMRSFVGVLLNAFISDHSIFFIDEPEAFLHPPQARLIGKMLAKDLPSERQLFLATHSEDFLKGILDTDTKNLKVIRIQRDDVLNKISVLNSSDISSIWNDSLLRHSNILNGLFHSGVIICESDSDCRFFSAILSAKYDNSTSIAPDILFTHCGGKHRIPIAVKALKKLDVPLKVVVDFDILNDISPLKDVFENLGGDWSAVVSEWTLVKKEIEQKRPEFLTEDLKKEIEGIFSATTERIFPKDSITKISKSLKKASAWTEAKETGKAFIPSGNATQAFEKIQLLFQEKGLFILEVGELECFAKSIGNHGPKWVNEVLLKDLNTDTELEDARKFVSQLIF